MSASEHEQVAPVSPSEASIYPLLHPQCSSPMSFLPCLFRLDYKYPPVDFDHDGEWDEEDQIGPAIHAPAYVKDIVVNKYRIEWLNLSEPETDFYSKNHMVATLIFAETVTIDDVDYSSARISMELSIEKKATAIVGQEVRISTHIYIPT